MAAVDALIDNLFRRQFARIVSSLTRTLGSRHLELIEEAVQDALMTALQQWPYRGVPDDPAGWLFRVARNRVLDGLRHQRVVDEKAPSCASRLRRRMPHLRTRRSPPRRRRSTTIS